jgi:branched-chain amino acid transport system ATP-binding protein
MLTVDRLDVSYGSLQVLWEVSLEVGKGEFVALIGSNGAGKTTLLRAISGLLRPSAGTITFRGEPIDALPTHEICRRGLIQVPEGRELFPLMSVSDNLAVGAYLPEARGRKEESLARVYRLFPRLQERHRQDAGTLSGGEQQMVAIGRGLMSRPALLMLDEPTLGLAPLLVQENLRALRQLNEEGLAILLVSQEVRQTLALADRAYVMENGHLTGGGPADAVLDDETIRAAYLGL